MKINPASRCTCLATATVLLILAALMVSFPLPSTADSRPEGLKVTILLFSGRPNPAFFLDDDASLAGLEKHLQAGRATEAVKEGTVIPSRLGYSGIVVENVARLRTFPGRIAVYGNRIEVRNDSVKFLSDNGELEAYLLREALRRKAIDEDLLNFIKSRQ